MDRYTISQTSTELVAQQFVEKFKLASLEDIAEVSGWLGDMSFSLKA